MQQNKIKGTPGLGLLGTTLGFFFGFAAVSLYGPTAIKFKEAMELTPVMMGLLVAIPALSGSLLRIPFGAWVDTTGGKKPFLILLILSVIGLGGITILLNFTYPDKMHGLYGLILFLGFLSGAGIATFSVGIAQTSYWFPKKKQGVALGAYAGLGNLAPGLFSLILPFYLQSFGFISAYFAWFLFLLIGTIIYAVISQNAYYFQFRKRGKNDKESRTQAKELGQEMFPAGNVKDSLINSAKIKNTWALVALYFTTFGGFIGLTAWFPIYWSQFHDFSLTKAGLFTAIFSLLASAIRVYGGKLADKAGGEKVSLVSLLLVLVASIFLSYTQSVLIGFFSVILLAVGMGVNNAAVFKLVPDYVPKAIGGAAGWIGGLGAFGGFVIPPIMGAIANTYGKIGYAHGFFVFIVLAIFNLGIIVYLFRQHQRKTEMK
ncbi:MFS transporter [Ancylomarina longa]|uniref:MFS transporter n=1 Tax=Ancylomarina longa TaxID=2487017 RepID=A0A434AV10_9BACT|nr:MFS transporter [Ancylomarina longa]RUT78275.1 MFS transporter [Ancylomarina longa]